MQDCGGYAQGCRGYAQDCGGYAQGCGGYVEVMYFFPKCVYPKCIFAKCTRLACLLSLASLFFGKAREKLQIFFCINFISNIYAVFSRIWICHKSFVLVLILCQKQDGERSALSCFKLFGNCYVLLFLSFSILIATRVFFM